MLYGEVRSTNDIDIIALLDRDAAKALPRVFPDSEFYCPPLEVIELERNRERLGHFNLIHHETGWKADIYLGSDDPLHAWALRNRRVVENEGVQIWLAPPEYVIIRKLEFLRDGGSEKHVRDVRGMLALDDLDRAFLDREIEQRQLHAQWQRVSKQ